MFRWVSYVSLYSSQLSEEIPNNLALGNNRHSMSSIYVVFLILKDSQDIHQLYKPYIYK